MREQTIPGIQPTKHNNGMHFGTINGNLSAHAMFIKMLKGITILDSSTSTIITYLRHGSKEDNSNGWDNKGTTDE